ncbi:hypothetical protein ABZS81_21415 [Streptomyces sp. NPDC005318]|uniref:hypothetical protein n=1 Tax=unclassified Streptomyces TaxID=2593676 RepID=UPI0023F81714|nr:MULTISPECIES: hypothetical protein [unclassified Streptomyces]MDF6043466.1 hypothetical protein [Streptomyces sp. JH14]
MPHGEQQNRDQSVPQATQGPRDTLDAPETDTERRRRRAQFLRELHEAKALRDRVQPRRARAARMRQAMRMRTFRW